MVIHGKKDINWWYIKIHSFKFMKCWLCVFASRYGGAYCVTFWYRTAPAWSFYPPEYNFWLWYRIDIRHLTTGCQTQMTDFNSLSWHAFFFLFNLGIWYLVSLKHVGICVIAYAYMFQNTLLRMYVCIW